MLGARRQTANDDTNPSIADLSATTFAGGWVFPKSCSFVLEATRRSFTDRGVIASLPRNKLLARVVARPQIIGCNFPGDSIADPEISKCVIERPILKHQDKKMIKRQSRHWTLFCVSDQSVNIHGVARVESGYRFQSHHI